MGFQLLRVARAIGLNTLAVIVSQGMAFLALPVLAVLYVPPDYGVYATYLAMTAVLALAFTLKIELNINKQGNLNWRSSAVASVVVMITMAIVVFGVIATARALYPGLNYGWFPDEYLWILAGALVSGLNSATLQVLVRKSLFTMMAVSQIIQSTLLLSLQLALPVFEAEALMGAHVFSQSILPVSVAYLFRHRLDLSLLSKNEIRQSLLSALPIIKYTFPGVLINTLGGQLPVLGVAAIGTIASVGLVGMALKITSVPAAVLAGPIQNVITGEFARASTTADASSTLVKFTLILMSFSIPAAVAAVMLIEYAVTVLLPASWSGVGAYSRWLVATAFISLIVSPVSPYFYLTGRAAVGFVFQTILFLLRVLGLCCGLATDDALLVIAGFSVGGGVGYLIYMIGLLHVSRCNWRAFAKIASMSAAVALVIYIISGSIASYFQASAPFILVAGLVFAYIIYLNSKHAQKVIANHHLVWE